MDKGKLVMIMMVLFRHVNAYLNEKLIQSNNKEAAINIPLTDIQNSHSPILVCNSIQCAEVILYIIMLSKNKLIYYECRL